MWVQFREEENPNGIYGKMYCIANRNVEVGIQQIRIVGQGTTEYVKFPSEVVLKMACLSDSVE